MRLRVTISPQSFPLVMEKLENWHADIVAKEESGSQLSVVSLFSHLKILLSPASIWGYLLNLFPQLSIWGWTCFLNALFLVLYLDFSLAFLLSLKSTCLIRVKIRGHLIGKKGMDAIWQHPQFNQNPSLRPQANEIPKPWPLLPLLTPFITLYLSLIFSIGSLQQTTMHYSHLPEYLIISRASSLLLYTTIQPKSTQQEHWVTDEITKLMRHILNQSSTRTQTNLINLS